jgi:hypothetical protein
MNNAFPKKNTRSENGNKEVPVLDSKKKSKMPHIPHI